MMPDKEIMQQMRDVLRPRGTGDIVRLHTEVFYETAFVTSCINEVTKLRMRAMLGDDVTPLEQLGLQVLLSSAHIKSYSVQEPL